jgi:hypothetical protein
MISEYNRQQAEALQIVRQGLRQLPLQLVTEMRASIDGYLVFRETVDRFFDAHFNAFCRPKCFDSRQSACCSKEGIVTFFADVVVNALVSDALELQRLAGVLQEQPPNGRSCVYLGSNGCRWRVTPIVCAMFICEAAQAHAYSADPDCRAAWKAIQRQRKTFTWPDRPVLFDRLEQAFLDAGWRSELMYLHNSPGMLRVKRQAGLG